MFFELRGISGVQMGGAFIALALFLIVAACISRGEARRGLVQFAHLLAGFVARLARRLGALRYEEVVTRSEAREDLIHIVFLLAGFVALVASRLPILRYDQVLNPDEALMAANAMRSQWGWINWDIVDPLTAGPLDSMVLAWPRLVGLPITLFNVRLTGIVLLALSLALLAQALRRLFDARVAMVAVLPAYLFLIVTNAGDFVHYSSEVMPIFLLSLGLFALGAYWDSRRSFYLVLTAFAAGCVPFAKLQGTPIAAVIGGIALWCAVRSDAASARSRLGIGAAVLAAGILPAAIFILPLLLSGGFDDFVKSYFTQQQLRVAGQEWTDKVTPMLLSTSFGWMAASYVALLLVGMIIALALRLTSGWKPRRAAIATALLALVLAAVSYASAVASGRAFPHYLLLGLPALVIMGGAAAALASPEQANWRLGAAVSFIGMTIVGLGILVPQMQREGAAWRPWTGEATQDLVENGRAFTVPRTLQWLRPEKGSRLVCWGWRAECYVDAAMAPATREATNENQLYNTELRDYFRERFIGDFKRTPPDYIVDVVAPGSFYFEDPHWSSISTFPAFDAILREAYVPVSHVADPSTCPRVYALRAHADELERSRIAFASIAAGSEEPGFTAAAVDDGSVFETCRDYWVPKKGASGSLRIEFASSSPVKRLLLLNTRDGERHWNSSGIARLALLSHGQEVWTYFVELRRFPFWTEVILPDPIPTADALGIDILSHWGFGGGLNEVKAYRN